MRSYQTGEYDTSGQLIKAEAITRSTGFEWDWLIPNNDQLTDAFKARAQASGARLLHWWYPQHVGLTREHRDIRAIVDILEKSNPDAVILEIPEQAGAWRQAFNLANIAQHPKLIGMFNYVPIHGKDAHGNNDIYQQVHGAINCDLFAFQLQAEKDGWIQATLEAIGEDAVKHLKRHKLMSNAKIWSVLYSVDLHGSKGPWACNSPSHDENVNFFFANRLSENPRTHWEDFLNAAQALKEAGEPISVWVANPNDALSDEELKKWPVVNREVKIKTRKDYENALDMADVVPILFPNCSVTVCEAVEARCLIMGPKREGLDGNAGTDLNTIGSQVKDAIQIVQSPHLGGKLTTQISSTRGAFSAEVNSGYIEADILNLVNQ
jgi:hypothetical protein